MDKLLTPEFWHMGGYAVYVWGCYGATLLVFVWNLWAPRWRRRAVMMRILDSRS